MKVTFLEWLTIIFQVFVIGLIIPLYQRVSRIEGYCKGRHSILEAMEKGEKENGRGD